MADVAPEVLYGQIIGRFVTSLADSGDAANVPDEVPLKGTVTLIPLTQIVRYPTSVPPRLVIAQAVSALIVNGDLCSPNGDKGVYVIATDQPNGQPNLVQWRAQFRFDNVSPSPPDVTFNVPSNGVVDLSLVVDVPAAPGTIVVVSHEDALAAKVSADTAVANAATATSAKNAAASSATNAATSASSASTSATNAGTSASNANKKVANFAALPTPAAAGDGQVYSVLDTDTVVVSDGTKWRLMYGDTGMRSVSLLMTDPSIVQSSPAPIGILQRSGNVVEFYADFLTVMAPTSPLTVITLPVGFRITNPYGTYGLLTAYVNSRATIGFPAPTAAILLYGAPGNVEDRYHGTWITSDPWPATLPGTFIGQSPA